MAECKAPDPIDPNLLPKIPESNLDTSTVTNGCVSGTGIYDVFMQAHLDSIHQEYAKQRLKGSDYSKVYLGGMQAAMQQAVAFALGKDQAAVQAELARYQMLKAASDIALVNAQICLVDAQIKETNNKALLAEKQSKLAEIQCWTEVSKITNNPSIAAKDLEDLVAPGNINGVFGAQIAKSKAEVDLIEQKTVTEEGQTDDSVFTPASILGRESTVRKYQANGFVRKAEVDAAKLYTDVHSVAMSALDAIEAPVGDTTVASAMDTASKGAKNMDDVD